MKQRLGLVVPAFEQGGGVPAVAMFMRRVVLASGLFDLDVVSLATARDDPASLRLARPDTWRGRSRTVAGEWSGVMFNHVGAFMPEFEFQRYRPRTVLTHALANCDLIQVVCGSSAWANAVVGIGKPVSLHVATRAKVERRMRDASPRNLADWWRRRMTAITDRMDDRALREVDSVQVMNPWMLEYVRSATIRRNIDVRYAPPGIDAQRYSPARVTERLRDPYILCVGRLDDQRKNIGLLLEAYLQLPGKVRDQVHLVLAGSGRPPAAFWQRANSAGAQRHIRYVARPDNDTLLELYRHASVFALPSDEEGFGMVLLEAMACGVPVVATRCGGPDGIITDGKDGFLVPLDDAAAMSARLLRLVQDAPLNAAMGDAARHTVECRFDERIAGDAFLDTWQRLLHKADSVRCAG